MKSTIAVKFANKFFADMAIREAEMAELPGAVCPTEDSPIRFEIIQEKLKLGGDTKTLKIFPVLAKLILGVNRSVKSIKDNPEQPKTNIPEELLRELEEYLFKMGASSIGYTKLPAQWVFQNKGTLHENLIVLTMKMDRERINMAPHPEAEYTVLATYRDLGEIANNAAVFFTEARFLCPGWTSTQWTDTLPALGTVGWIGSNSPQWINHHPGIWRLCSTGSNLYQH